MFESTQRKLSEAERAVARGQAAEGAAVWPHKAFVASGARLAEFDLREVRGRLAEGLEWVPYVEGGGYWADPAHLHRLVAEARLGLAPWFDLSPFEAEEAAA